jgi:hypothetical protein
MVKMSMGAKDEPQYVTLEFCNERFNRIMDKLGDIDRKVTELRDIEKERARDWKMFILSVSSGAIVALITWLLSHL